MMEQKKKKHGKVFILIVIAIILLIVVTIVLACIFSGKDKSEEDIGKVYYYQTELEHIACDNSGIIAILIVFTKVKLIN